MVVPTVTEIIVEFHWSLMLSSLVLVSLKVVSRPIGQVELKHLTVDPKVPGSNPTCCFTVKEFSLPLLPLGDQPRAEKVCMEVKRTFFKNLNYAWGQGPRLQSSSPLGDQPRAWR